MAPTLAADAQARRAYLRRLAHLGLSGAVYTLIVLWVNQAAGDGLFGTRLIDEIDAPPAVVAMLLMCFTTLPLTWLMAWIYAKVTSLRDMGTWPVVWRWLLGVFGLWLTWLFVGDIGIPVFLAFWGVFAWMVTPRRLAVTATKGKPKVYPLPDDPKPQASRRRQSRGGMAGTFGRIPKETEVLLKELVRQVTDTIVRALPHGTPGPVRRATVRIVLDVVLETWWSENRVDPLDAIDVERLKDTILLAADLAGSFDAVGQGVYRGVLRGLVRGWQYRRLS